MRRKRTKKSPISTKDVLDKALDEIAIEENSSKGPKHAAGSSKKLIYALSVALIVVACVCFVYMFFLTNPDQEASEQKQAVAVKPKTAAEQAQPAETVQDMLAKASQPEAADAEKTSTQPPPETPPPSKIEGPASEQPQEQQATAKEPPTEPEPQAAPAVPKSAPKTTASPPLRSQAVRLSSTELPPVAKEKIFKIQPQSEKRVGRFAINAGSYKLKSKAEAELAKLQDAGFKSYIEEIDLVDKGIWYRVKVGRFSSKEEAEAAQEKLQKKLGLQAFIYSRSAP